MRVSDTDRQEAELQARGRLRLRSRTSLPRGSARAASVTMGDAAGEEDTFVAQLVARSRILDPGFQAAVLSTVRGRAAAAGPPSPPPPSRRHSLKGCIDAAGLPGVVEVDCLFDCGVGPVLVEAGPPKRADRMRAKLAKYRPPHPRSAWPLAGNILDPIRAAVVCRGPAQILEAAAWFTSGRTAATGQRLRGGLRVWRVKNRFEEGAEEGGGEDGYRDLKLNVAYQGIGDLCILGEVQVRSRCGRKEVGRGWRVRGG